MLQIENKSALVSLFRYYSLLTYYNLDVQVLQVFI